MAKIPIGVIAKFAKGLRAADVIGLIGGLTVILGFFTPWANILPEASGALYAEISIGYALLTNYPLLIVVYVAGMVGSLLSLWSIFAFGRYLPTAESLSGAMAIIFTFIVAAELNSFGLNGGYLLSENGCGPLFCLIGGGLLVIGGFIGIRGATDRISFSPRQYERTSLKWGVIGVIGGLIIAASMALPWFSLTLVGPGSASTTFISSGLTAPECMTINYLAVTIGIAGIFFALLGTCVRKQIQILTMMCGAAVTLIGIYDAVSYLVTYSYHATIQESIISFGIEIGVIAFIIGGVLMFIGGMIGKKERQASVQPSSATPSTTN